MAEFSESIGMEKREKVVEGMKCFSIVAIKFTEGYRDYEIKKGDATVNGKLGVVHIDAIEDGTEVPMQLYSSAGAIIASCKEIVKKFGVKGSNKLKEPVHIKEVCARESGKKGKEDSWNPYLYFT